MKKKILVFGFTELYGGIENFYINYYRLFAKEEYDFTFVCPDKKMAFSDEINKSGGKIVYVHHFKKNIFKYCFEIFNLINKNKYDIIHINMLSNSNIIPVIVCNLLKSKKIIIHSHASGIIDSNLKKFLNIFNRIFYLKNSRNHYIACSKKAGKWMFGEKIDFKIINNSVSYSKFLFSQSNRNRIRKNLGIKPNDYVLGHIGRFSNEKNQQFLIDVIEKLTKYNNMFKLILIGDGPTKNLIKQEIQERKLSKNTIILDSTCDVAKYYNTFDLFLFPSLYEGLGLVAIEAQINGLNCIFSENIVNEVDINSDNKYINLDNIDNWVKSIIEYSNKKRGTFNQEKMNSKGFNIDLEFIKLKNIYDMEDNIYE